jgi:uncharacterized protein (TIGR00290 family)
MESVLVSWSGGKDSALALHAILKRQDYKIAALFTTLTADYDRISMHGVRRALLEQQASALGLPLEEIFISKNAANAEYETKLAEVLQHYRAAGLTTVVFGDIFLQDLRQYREDNLARLGMKALFPLWQRDTRELARSLMALGFKAVTTCVDTHALDKRFVGREIDEQFLSELPPSVDPCGENGEFHSFVYAGPLFTQDITHTRGEVILRDNRFYYCDLVPS